MNDNRSSTFDHSHYARAISPNAIHCASALSLLCSTQSKLENESENSQVSVEKDEIPYIGKLDVKMHKSIVDPLMEVDSVRHTRSWFHPNYLPVLKNFNPLMSLSASNSILKLSVIHARERCDIQ